ncbi:MAG: N-acetylmuramoyl-L-alanine amidase [Acidobacteriota bacterium]|nr:N-acetylmuramoyl-L-alanine amidase [Acidobacteriota bacterium]
MLACAFAPPVAAKAGGLSARALYNRTLERERQVRATEQQATIVQLRGVVNAYSAIVRRFPASGYSDNALWQGGNLALLAFERFGQAADRRTAEHLLRRLKEQYPSSSLAARVDEALGGSDAPATSPPPAAVPIAVDTASLVDSSIQKAAATGGTDRPDDTSPSTQSPAVMIRDIKRSPIPEGMRITIEMDAETTFRAERLENPRRVFFDLKGTRPVPSLLDATLRFNDDIVREIRLGRHPQTTTRIVFDMAGVDSYSVFTLYSPYRLVIDFKPQTSTDANLRPQTDLDKGGVQAGTDRNKPQKNTDAPRAVKTRKDTKHAASDADEGEPSSAIVPSLSTAPLPPPGAAKIPALPAPEPPAKPASRSVVSSAPIPPALPSANSDGKFSIARQLGLGVSRIVIDAGHGGHDPGAQSNGVSESELTLDVATRLSRLLEKEPGVDVVMTRDTDVFIPLEERTAIANREGADLFLSIHANASRNPRARGVETYFLNFASNPDAEAVAARENSSSGRAMHSLPDIVRAIALNNKIDESRDFADMVQHSMVNRLSTRNKLLKDLGVKQAPFVVLIGAAMPSVLAEISFVTNKPEGQLLKSSTYRQQIAEALLDAVLRYQQSLKRPRAGVVGLGAR